MDSAYKNTGLDLIDTIVPLIQDHCISSYKQITAIAVFDIGYVAAYAGLQGTAHYLFDLSSSGSGKDSSVDHSRELLLAPIAALQMEDAKNYAEDKRNDRDLPSKMFKCIHGGDSTVQAIYKGFEEVHSQCIRRGEVGVLLSDKTNPMMNFITDAYGKKNIEMPSYKKEIDSNIPLEVNNASMFFYGNSNLSMLSIGSFKYHMMGGLLNRCLLLFENYRRSFDYMPKTYDLPQQQVDNIHIIIHEFIIWGKKHKHINKPSLKRTPEYMKFSKWVYDKEDELRGSESQEIYKRTMQNLNAIIYTFHYLSCFEDGIWRDETTTKTTLNAIKYLKWIISKYPNLIDEIKGVNADVEKEVQLEKDEVKVFEKIAKYSYPKMYPISAREIYRSCNMVKSRYIEIARKRYTLNNNGDILSPLYPQ